jgi:RHS repeat-associated protein
MIKTSARGSGLRSYIRIWGQKPRKACLLPARSPLSPRTHWRNRRRVRRRASGRSFAYNLRFPGQVFDGQAGLHQNAFRDFDPASGRYVESDPLGLKAGINTYTYVADQPTRRIDPSGLFTLNPGASWSMVDSLPGRDGGLTNYIMKTRCTCKGGCGSWTLGGCSSTVIARVDLLGGVSDPNEAAFYRNGEAQHVADLYAGAGAIYRAGADAEQSVRNPVFNSKYDCESNALNVVSAAVLAATNSVAQASVDRWDKSGAVSLEYVGVSGPSVLFDLKNGSAKKISFRGTYSMLKGADPWDSQIVCRTPNDTTGYEHPIALQNSIPASIIISPGDQMRLRIGNEIAAGDKGARCRLRLKLEDRTVLESTEFVP